MCANEICPCRWHSMKINDDFFDIFEGSFLPWEEIEIERKAEADYES